MTWIQTAAGRAFDLLTPEPEAVDFDEIALALAHINRFTGHAGAYSVAQHCAHGCDYLLDRGERAAALTFLLHDAHEAYLGDIASPVTAAFAALDPYFKHALHGLRAAIDDAIHSAAGLMVTSDVAARVKEIDVAMLRTERDQLMAPPPRAWVEAVERAAPLPINIDRLATPEIAQRRWIGRFRRMTSIQNGGRHAG